MDLSVVYVLLCDVYEHALLVVRTLFAWSIVLVLRRPPVAHTLPCFVLDIYMCIMS